MVQIEKQADMIIADHVRKDIPPGSISWKFIEQSVAKGALEDLDDYRAGRVVGTIREVGSAQPARKGKIAFTAEDDRILMEWCIKAERKGLSVKGNEIYKQLEEKVKLSVELRWTRSLIHSCRTIGIPSSPGEIVGLSTSLIAHDLHCPRMARMKMMPRPRTTNAFRTTAQSSDLPKIDGMFLDRL